MLAKFVRFHLNCLMSLFFFVLSVNSGSFPALSTNNLLSRGQLFRCCFFSLSETLLKWQRQRDGDDEEENKNQTISRWHFKSISDLMMEFFFSDSYFYVFTRSISLCFEIFSSFTSQPFNWFQEVILAIQIRIH